MKLSSWSSLGVAVSMAVLACCSPAGGDGLKGDRAASERIACLDPETGEMIEPGEGIDCRVPAPAGAEGEPVVRDLEGGGKAIDLEGRLDQHRDAPVPGDSIAVIDPRTGEMMGPRPSEPAAAARYDRIMTRALLVRERRSAAAALADGGADLQAEPLEGGGMKIDVRGRFLTPLTAARSGEGEIELRHGGHAHGTGRETLR